MANIHNKSHIPKKHLLFSEYFKYKQGPTGTI